MIALLTFEIKKILYSWKRCALLAIIILFPLIQVVGSKALGQREAMVYNQKSMSIQEQKEYQDKIRLHMAGVIDESFLEVRESELLHMEEEKVNENDLRYQTIHYAYYDALHALNARKSISENSTIPPLIKKDLKTSELRYGSYHGWLDRMEIFKNSAICYLLLCILLFSNLFNQEYHVEIMDVLKSTTYGRKKLALAKLASVWLISVLTGILMYLVLELSTRAFFDLAGSDTTVMMLKNPMQIFNFSQLNIQALVLFLVGGLGCALFSTFVSVVFQKPKHSLLLSSCFFLIPIICSFEIANIPYSQFFPSVFVNFHGNMQILREPWLYLSKHLVLHRTQALCVIWSIIIILLSICSIYVHCHTKHKFIRKKVNYERIHS